MFCPDCGSILRPKVDKLQCSCGYASEPKGASPEIVEVGKMTKRVEVMEKVDIHPKIKATCEKCKNKIALYWTQQTRGADEPETRFFRCTKCSYTWREYA